MSRGTGQGNAKRKLATEAAPAVTLEDLARKVDSLSQAVHGLTPGTSAADLSRLRWWGFAMGAVTVAALTVAAAVVAAYFLIAINSTG